jgi:hypothetical protein
MRVTKIDLHVKHEIVRNCFRRKRQMLSRHPVTPKVIYTQDKAKTVCFWIKSKVLLNEDMSFNDVTYIEYEVSERTQL